MPENDLVTFMRRLTAEQEQEYRRIQERVAEDPGTAGDQGEENWATLLRNWLPQAYRVVTKGRLLGPDGSAGPQVDVLVLSPAYPQYLVDKKLYLTGGVVAAFECKLTLRKFHLDELFKNCMSIRPLIKRTTGTPLAELRSPLIYGLLAHSHEWKSVGSTPEANINRTLGRCDADATKHPSDMPDVVCVSDVGLWDAWRMIFPARPDSGFQFPNESNVEIRSMYMSHVYLPSGPNKQYPYFTPIGSLLSTLYRRISWVDPTMRDFSRHFDSLGGFGSAVDRHWPIHVLSGPLRRTLKNNVLKSGVWFDEWSMGPY